MQRGADPPRRTDERRRAGHFEQPPALAEEPRLRLETFKGRAAVAFEVHVRVDADVDVEAERFQRLRRRATKTVPASLVDARRHAEIAHDRVTQRRDLRALEVRA